MIIKLRLRTEKAKATAIAIDRSNVMRTLLRATALGLYRSCKKNVHISQLFTAQLAREISKKKKRNLNSGDMMNLTLLIQLME